MKWMKWPVWRWVSQAATVLSPRHVCCLYHLFAQCIAVAAGWSLEIFQARSKMEQIEDKIDKLGERFKRQVGNFWLQKLSAIRCPSLFEIDSDWLYPEKDTSAFLGSVWVVQDMSCKLSSIRNQHGLLWRIWRHLESSWCQASSSRAVAKAGFGCSTRIFAATTTEPKKGWTGQHGHGILIV